MIIGTTFRELNDSVWNAVSSWKAAFPTAIIAFLGKETFDAADELGVDFKLEVSSRSDQGVPRLDGLFGALQELASSKEPVLYANSDICFFPDASFVISAVARAMGSRPWLLTGQRLGYEVKERIDWGSRAALELKLAALDRGKYLPACGADYFVFNRATFGVVPPFTIGRCTYDNWCIYHCLYQAISVFNATHHIVALHQDHVEDKNARHGEEAQANRALCEAMYPNWTPWMGWVSEGEKLPC